MQYTAVLEALKLGKTAQAIQLLKESEINGQQWNILSLIEGEFNRMETEALKGTITADQHQSKLNRINERLLSLLSVPPENAINSFGRQKVIGLVLGLIVAFSLCLYLLMEESADCPEFDTAANTRLLILPFENIGQQTAKPHLLLRDRIDGLIVKHNLSFDAHLGDPSPDISIEDATALALECGANAIAWGKYSASSDSIRLVLQYHFLDGPDLAATSELHALKNVTAIQTGALSSNLEDVIFALCGIVVLRQDNSALGQRWLDKVVEPEVVDKEIVKAIQP